MRSSRRNSSLCLSVAFVLAATIPAFTQQSYAPPDQQLWELLDRELHKLAMSEDAHVGVRAIMQQVQREAQARASRARADETKPAASQ